MVIGCSDATLSLRALILPSRLWYHIKEPISLSYSLFNGLVVKSIVHSNNSSLNWSPVSFIFFFLLS